MVHLYLNYKLSCLLFLIMHKNICMNMFDESVNKSNRINFSCELNYLLPEHTPFDRIRQEISSQNMSAQYRTHFTDKTLFIPKLTVLPSHITGKMKFTDRLIFHIKLAYRKTKITSRNAVNYFTAAFNFVPGPLNN